MKTFDIRIAISDDDFDGRVINQMATEADVYGITRLIADGFGNLLPDMDHVVASPGLVTDGQLNLVYAALREGKR